MIELDNCSIPKKAALIGTFVKLLGRAGPMEPLDTVSRVQSEWYRVSSARLVLFDYFQSKCPVFSILGSEASDAGARYVIRLPGLATIGSDEKNLVAVRAFFQQDCRTIVAESNHTTDDFVSTLCLDSMMVPKEIRAVPRSRM
jgi:hypothetical protein